MIAAVPLKGDIGVIRRKFEVVRVLLGKDGSGVVDVQISGSRVRPPYFPGSQTREMFGSKWYLHASRTGGTPVHIEKNVAEAFEACFLQTMEDQGCVWKDVASFSMMLWAPWTWDSQYLGLHEDDAWVGEKIILGNVMGEGYKMGLWSSRNGPKNAPVFVSLSPVGVPSQYTLEGTTRWGMAHGGCFSACKDNNVHKYRLGMDLPQKHRAAWKFKGRSKSWQNQLRCTLRSTKTSSCLLFLPISPHSHICIHAYPLP